MHCYRYLAAVGALSEAIDSLPNTEHRLPYSILADWMEENGIDADELLQVSGEEVRTIVETIISQHQPPLPHAA